jgi:uncharacterized membrane protein
MQAENEKKIHEAFEISIVLKGIHAVIEVVGGALLYLVPTDYLARIITNITQDELIQDSGDLIANYLLHVSQVMYAGGKTFAAWYLLSHGVIKVVLVIGLLRDKLWAYQASLVVLVVFIAYQLYRYSHTHSVGLLVLTVFDIVVIWLVSHEYRVKRGLVAIEQ